MSERRSKLQIYADILRLIRRKGNRAKPTHILYGANLSHKRLKVNLELLLDTVFIERISLKGRTYYKLTKKGEQFLTEFKKIEEITHAFGL